MTSATGKVDPVLDNIFWSGVEYRFSEFVDRFTLPQLVKVLTGYHGFGDEPCIGSDQILTIHSIKTIEKALARDLKERELRIPLSCSQKIELCPQHFQGISETAKELSKFKFVRVTRTFDDEGHSVSPGDKLKVIRVKRGVGGKEDCIQLEHQDRGRISLPFAAIAGLQPLIDGREYYLKEAVNKMKLPVFFQFVNSRNPEDKAENVFNSSVGVLKLEQTYEDSTVICTTKVGSVRTVVTCPKELPITVTVAQGALEGDKDYVRLCRVFHEGASLTKIDNMELENMYESRSTIREYEYIDMPRPPATLPRKAPIEAKQKRSGNISGLPAANIGCPSASTKEREGVKEDSEKNASFADYPVKQTSKPDFVIPGQLSQLSVGEVSKFLKKVHLEDFVDVFAENDVDGEFLVTMTAEDMRALEMNAFQCKKLLKLISGWRPKV